MNRLGYGEKQMMVICCDTCEQEFKSDSDLFWHLCREHGMDDLEAGEETDRAIQESLDLETQKHCH